MAYLTQTHSELYGTLADNHERLERLFALILTELDTKGPSDIHAEWSHLDEELRAHLRTEDELLLPSFELQAGAEAARVRTEHDLIRRELDELGSEIDLDAVDRNRAKQFIQLLHEHLHRDELELYPWADSTLPRRVRGSVIERLRQSRGERTPWRFEPRDAERGSAS